MKTKRKNDGVRRYRPDRASILFYGYLGLAWGFGGMMFLYASVKFFPLYIVGCPPFLFVSLRTFRYSYRLAVKTYLLVAPSHLQFSNSSYTGAVRWHQVTGINRIHYRINNHQAKQHWNGFSFDWSGDGFILAEEQLFECVEDMPPIITDTIPIKECVVIPRRYRGFGAIVWDKFAQTDFGRDLHHYAPHLFKGKLPEKAKVG